MGHRFWPRIGKIPDLAGIWHCITPHRATIYIYIYIHVYIYIYIFIHSALNICNKRCLGSTHKYHSFLDPCTTSLTIYIYIYIYIHIYIHITLHVSARIHYTTQTSAHYHRSARKNCSNNLAVPQERWKKHFGGVTRERTELVDS